MSDGDFDLQRLADYLHLSVAQVSKMVSRGEIPGRRVNEEWRFSPGEIHHWLESRIGASTEEELVGMEHVLRGPRRQEAAAKIVLSELIPREAIELHLDARTRSAVFPAIVKVAARTGFVWDENQLAEALRTREELHSTALDNGVALMHARRPQVSILGDAFIAIGRVPGGIPFGNQRGAMTDLFILICMLDDRTHLRALARLSRLVMDADLLAGLRAAETAHDAWDLINATEQRILAEENGSSE
jgi:nitrogen PTS system EIIA component